jgi:Family of unknown function (DUF5681)
MLHKAIQSMSDDEQDVGYRKPPRSTRFRTGASGNPSGKKKGTRNFSTEIRDELATEVNVTIDGQTQRMSKQRALAIALVTAAISGDLRATAIILTFARGDEANENDAHLDEEQRRDEFSTVRSLMARRDRAKSKSEKSS